MGKKISISQLSAAVMEAVREYADTATEEVKQAVTETGDTVQDEIRRNAPKDTGALCAKLDGQENQRNQPVSDSNRTFQRPLPVGASPGIWPCQAGWRPGCRTAAYRPGRRTWNRAVGREAPQSIGGIGYGIVDSDACKNGYSLCL